MGKRSDGIGPRDLQEGLEFIAYEWEMLHRCAIEADKLEPGYQQNSYLESFLIHARGLWEFFYRDRPAAEDKQDALAVRYFPSGVWERARPNEENLSRLIALPDGVAREIAHLSWRRLRNRGGKTTWDVPGILSEIRSVMAVFRDVLTQRQAKLNITHVQTFAQMPVFGSSNFTTTRGD